MKKIYISGSDLIDTAMNRIGHINNKNEYVFDDEIDTTKMRFIRQLVSFDLSNDYASMDIELFEDGSIIWYEEGEFALLGHVNKLRKKDLVYFDNKDYIDNTFKKIKLMRKIYKNFLMDLKGVKWWI